MGLGRVRHFFMKVWKQKGLRVDCYWKELSSQLEEISCGTSGSNWLQEIVD